jgi:hypothetical protein
MFLSRKYGIKQFAFIFVLFCQIVYFWIEIFMEYHIILSNLITQNLYTIWKKHYSNVSFLLDLILKYMCNMTARSLPQHPIDVHFIDVYFIDVYFITYRVWLVLMQKEILDTQNDTKDVFWNRKQNWNTSHHIIDTM